jgi:hypothetical protein
MSVIFEPWEGISKEGAWEGVSKDKALLKCVPWEEDEVP